MPDPDALLDALRASVTRLHDLVESLSPDQYEVSAYPSEWTVADTLSHLGSGATIHHRRIADTLAGAATPDDYPQSVWDEWNAKSPKDQATDSLVADRALLEIFESIAPTTRDTFSI